MYIAKPTVKSNHELNYFHTANSTSISYTTVCNRQWCNQSLAHTDYNVTTAMKSTGVEKQA